MKRILLASIVSLAASSAMAADVIYQEPAPMPMDVVSAVDWTGFYVGAQAGYGFGDTDTLVLTPFTAGLTTAFAPGFSGDFDDGFIGGIHAGYDWQVNRLVFGGVLDVNYADIGDAQVGMSVTPATYTIAREIDYLVNARIRGGFLVTERVLAYGTVGLAYADVDFTYTQPGSAATFTTAGGQDDNIGYTVGGGVEAMITDRLSLGLEYLYTNLGGNDFSATLTGGPFGGPGGAAGSTPGGTVLTGGEDDFDFHTVAVRLSYRF